MGKAQISLTVILSIVATGALLNLANSGVFGEQVKTAANYVIKGYGV